MGAGVAKYIKAKWPLAFVSYTKLLKECALSKISPLGKISLVKVEETALGTVFVVNAITQLSYGRQPGRRYADVSAIEQSLSTFFEWIESTQSIIPIYMPKIGCGLGGLDWDNDVRPIIEYLDGVYQLPLLYVCSL